MWALLLRCTGLLSLARWWVSRSGVLVLTFHRVLGEDELQHTMSLPGMIVRTETFDRFLQYASQRWKLVDLGKQPDWTGDSRLKVGITFDDGWCDNVTHAYPVARKHKVPITIFIVPEKMGSVLPFWPEQAALSLAVFPPDMTTTSNGDHVNRVIEDLKELPAEQRRQRIEQMLPDKDALSANSQVDRTMSWEQTEALKDGGVVFGSHTSSHEILIRIPVSEAEREITASRGLIQERLHLACSLFAYPNGDCSPEVRDLVEKAGYRVAFLNDQADVWAPDCDPYMVPRVNVCEHHLIDSRGRFSPLMFDYTVLWRVAEGMLTRRCWAWFSKLKAGSGNGRHPNRADQRGESATG